MLLTHWAWSRGADCVCVDGRKLLPFLGLERMKSERAEWLKDDVRLYFPHVELLDETGRKKNASVYLSRQRFPSGAFSDMMPDSARAKKLTELGLTTVVAKLPSETKAVEVLARMSYGLYDFPIPEETDKW